MTTRSTRYKRIHVKTPKARLDKEEFSALQDSLFYALKEKDRSCAKALGIDKRTWMGWWTKPPKWPFWNIVLRTVIKEILSRQLAYKHGASRKHYIEIKALLSKIPHGEEYLNEIEWLAYDYTGAEAHLRRLLTPKGMFLHDILKPANNGGYSRRALFAAANAIGIAKAQEGYGKAKIAYWRLPDGDDLFPDIPDDVRDTTPEQRGEL